MRLIPLAVPVSFLLSIPVHAAIINVAPGGSVQEALSRAKAGDTVRLAPGVYRERVTFKNSGTYGKPVTLEGAPGAILDGSENVALDWQPATDIAPATYRAKVPLSVFTLTAEGKIVTMLREDRVKPGATEKDDRGNLWDYTKLFQVGVGPSKWEGVKALSLYLSKSKEVLVRFKDDLDPRQLKITVVPREPIIKISGTNRCVVRRLILRNAAYGVFIENSLGSVVENCTIGPVDYGVWLSSGSDQATLRFNEMFMNPYAGADPKGVGAWDNWTAHKRGGHYDRFGVQIYKTRGGHEVHDNYIHDTWDGIEDRGAAGENRGLHIHHNRIFNVSDDGLEPNGAEEHCHWNDNIVEKSICGFRIKAITHGPMYAYRNIFLSNGEDFRNYGEVELKPATAYIYHNTGTARAAVQSNKVFGIGTPNYYYFNNLFWCDYWWGDSGKSVPPNWKGDYNAFVRRGENPRWDETKAIAVAQKMDEHSLWTQGEVGFTDFTKHDVSLKANSPVRGRGADLTKLLGKPLPGLEAGYFKGAAPDAGALQFGEAMPQLPRKAQEVNAPPAGSWPGPEVEAELEKQNALQPVLLNGGFEKGLEGWGNADPKVFQVKTENGAPYLANDTAWQKRGLKFTAPGPEVTLEISVRATGLAEVDNFVVEKVK